MFAIITTIYSTSDSRQYITKLQAIVRVLSNILGFKQNLQSRISLNAVLHCLIAHVHQQIQIYGKNQIHVVFQCQVVPSCKMYAHWIYISVDIHPRRVIILNYKWSFTHGRQFYITMSLSFSKYKIIFVFYNMP